MSTITNKPMLDSNLNHSQTRSLELTYAVGGDVYATRDKVSKTYPTEQKLMPGWNK